MDGWPSSWRCLSALSIAWEATVWVAKKVIYQFDPDRRYR